MAKLWGGRFKAEPSELMTKFGASHQVDRRLYREDILLNKAYAAALVRADILSGDECFDIRQGLDALRQRIAKGKVVYHDELEDIHTHIENWLTAEFGDSARKMHTGKSRNDQVATDLRLYLMRVLPEFDELLQALIQQLETHLMDDKQYLPGFTHLQKAQPVTLALHFGAYRAMFRRDGERLRDALKRIRIMPLGAGALAGNPFLTAHSRELLANELEFDAVAENSMDAVSDRDFVVEVLAAMALIAVHLSRLSEELVLWSTEAFAYLEIGDAFTTGSSLMPHKKNPDAAELIRGKTGRVFGALQAVLTMLKGLPLTYNRDMQEDKELLFDALDTVETCLQVMTQMIGEITLRRERLRADAGGFTLATAVADYLVQKGMPFRTAHGVVGQLVQHCIAKGTTDLQSLSLIEYQRFAPLFADDIYSYLSARLKD